MSNLLQHTGNDGLVTMGTHTTPIARYVDDLTFTFIPGDGCLVDVRNYKSLKFFILKIQAYSQSETLSLLDYGTNYCNLFNLMDGSGLVNDPSFSEDTSNSICTQWSTADCDIY